MNSYLSLCTSFYDTDKPQAPQDALDFYLRYAVASKGPILEPMCGSGRFLVPMAQRGLDIDGIDASPHMLAACREKCERLGLKSRVEQQFLHELDLPRQYGLVFIAAGSLSLITELSQVRESMKQIHDVMLPGAKFVFETGRNKPKESSSWPWGGRWVQRADGAKIIISWLGRHDAQQSITSSIHRYELIRDGQLLKTEFEDFNIRHYDLPELQEVLEGAGFTAIRVLKLFEQRAPDDADDEVIIECVRP